MVRINPLSIAIVGAACVTIGSAVTASSAQASTITNNFRVDITQGTLANQSFFGNFTYDDSFLSGTGFESLTPSNGFLNLSFNFLDNIYTQENDVDSPDFPEVAFQDGSLLGLGFVVSENLAFPNPTFIPGSIRAFGTLGPDFQVLVDGKSDLDPDSLGTVSYGVQAVPTPALLPGLIGLGVGVLRKRRAAVKKARLA